MIKKYLNVLMFVVVFAAILSCYFILESKIPKVAYVDIEKVYNEFSMKKELESKLINVQQARKLILDSLKIELNALSQNIKSEKDVANIQNFQFKKQEYLLKEERFNEDNQATTDSYNSQIWKQIKQYVKDYGKQNAYTIISGADETAVVLYGDENVNITETVIKYVNERYAGGDK